MGSVQQSAAATHKHEAADDKVRQEAAAGSNTSSAKLSGTDVASCHIENQTLGLSLNLLKHHVWFGTIVGTYPPSIKRDTANGITSRGDPAGDSAGSKVAVVYAGSNVWDGANNCAWLLAWHAPADGTTPCKIYVEAGDISKYSDDLKWEEIEAKLDASSEQGYYIDDDTKCEASAKIDNKGYKIVATAVFDVAG